LTLAVTVIDSRARAVPIACRVSLKACSRTTVVVTVTAPSPMPSRPASPPQAARARARIVSRQARRGNMGFGLRLGGEHASLTAGMATYPCHRTCNSPPPESQPLAAPRVTLQAGVTPVALPGGPDAPRQHPRH